MDRRCRVRKSNPRPTGKSLNTKSLGLICRRGDSNPHELPHTPLKRARLPVPPLRLIQEGCQKTRNPSGLLAATSSGSPSVSVLATETEQVAESRSALALPSAREFRTAKLNWCH